MVYAISDIPNMNKVVNNVLMSEIDDYHSVRLFESIHAIYMNSKRKGIVRHPNLSDTG